MASSASRTAAGRSRRPPGPATELSPRSGKYARCERNPVRAQIAISGSSAAAEERGQPRPAQGAAPELAPKRPQRWRHQVAVAHAHRPGARPQIANPRQSAATASASAIVSTSRSGLDLGRGAARGADSRRRCAAAVSGALIGTPTKAVGPRPAQADRPVAAVVGRAEHRVDSRRRRAPAPPSHQQFDRELRGVHADQQRRPGGRVEGAGEPRVEPAVDLFDHLEPARQPPPRPAVQRQQPPARRGRGDRLERVGERRLGERGGLGRAQRRAEASLRIAPAAAPWRSRSGSGRPAARHRSALAMSPTARIVPARGPGHLRAPDSRAVGDRDLLDPPSRARPPAAPSPAASRSAGRESRASSSGSRRAARIGPRSESRSAGAAPQLERQGAVGDPGVDRPGARVPPRARRASGRTRRGSPASPPAAARRGRASRRNR